MDDATKVIESLERKLKELDLKVASYREEMAGEFQHHSQAILQDASPDLSAKVHRAIADALHKYPALRPSLNLAASVPLRRSSDRRAWHGRGSPPPNFRRDRSPDRDDDDDRDDREDRDDEEPVSPRRRSEEFQGLFTPSYLPLLDSSDSQSPQSPPAISEVIEKKKPDVSKSSPAPAQGQDIPARPSTVRRATDDTTGSSVLSDRSCDAKSRRSALRRRSSSSKPLSPRRVRFDVAGAEVLPSSSPQTTIVLSESLEDATTLSLRRERTAEEILGPDLIPEPPPKKVSSSQKLRELSRAPLNDRTVWETITQQPLESVDELELAAALSVTNSTSTIHSLKNIGRKSMAVDDTMMTAESIQAHSPPDETEEQESDEDSDSDGGNFLTIGKMKSFTGKTPISPRSRSPGGKSPVLPPGSPAGTNFDGKPKSTTVVGLGIVRRSPLGEDEDDDEEELPFEMDDGRNKMARSAIKKSDPEDEPESDDEPGSLVEKKPAAANLGQYSSSPAVSIPKLGATGPPTPTTARFQVGSVGSYKGRPVTMPVVRNARLVEEAESMGEFTSFVGGVDGRSGMDDADLSSFRASLTRPSTTTGAPRSFTERLIIEEAAEARAQMQRESGTTSHGGSTADNTGKKS